QAPRGASARGGGAFRALRACRPDGPLPRPALGRPATARGDHPRACHAARGDAVRRGDIGARPRARGRGAGRAPGAEGGRHDHGARDARDGLRPRGGRQGLLPRRRPHPGGGAALGDLCRPARGPDPRLPCPRSVTPAGVPVGLRLRRQGAKVRGEVEGQMTDRAVAAAVSYVQDRAGIVPEVALVLGSGLGPLADAAEGVAVPYADIPGFPVSTAPGHASRLILGRLFGRACVVMQGRVHMYEGYSPQEVVFPIRVMAALGARTLVLTNAAGGMHPEDRVGNLVVIEDHLSLAIASGLDPLRGPNDPAAGPRFVSMNRAYDPGLVALAEGLGGLRRG